MKQKVNTSKLAYSRPLETNWKKRLLRQLEAVNKELWLILSLFVLVGIMNYLVVGHRIMLGLYTLPTIISAYLYGRRHATLTAFASILLVSIVVYNNPQLFTEKVEMGSVGGRWYDILSWGLILLITAYAMGTLYEKVEARINELRGTYRGLIVILRHFISKDKYTENHCYRVSIYATKIAGYLGLSSQKIEDIRSAALLHDLGKLDISRELLHKASQLTSPEYEDMKKHVGRGVEMLETADTPLNRILPIILSHHEKHDGTGYYQESGNEIPIEAKVISVADVYDALTSDRPYRKAMPPYEARDQIIKGSGTQFDPRVVKAFLKVFERGEMDVPQVII
ncbi:MAG: HD-GYP domain-containing protein [Desulfobacterales bacterium]